MAFFQRVLTTLSQLKAYLETQLCDVIKSIGYIVLEIHGLTDTNPILQKYSADTDTGIGIGASL